MSAKVDIRQFQQGLKAAGERGRRAAYQAMQRAAAQTIGDAQQIAPIDTGDLRASGQLGRASGTKLEVEIGFNTDYAAIVHEDLTANHPNGGESKFLEKSIRNMQPKLLGYLAGEVRKVL